MATPVGDGVSIALLEASALALPASKLLVAPALLLPLWLPLASGDCEGLTVRNPLLDTQALPLAVPNPGDGEEVPLLQGEGDIVIVSAADAEGDAVLETVSSELGEAVLLPICEGEAVVEAVPVLLPPSGLIVGVPNKLALPPLLREAASDGEPRDGEGCAEAPLPSGDAVAGIDGEAVAEDPASGEAVGGPAVPVGEGRADSDGARVVESWPLMVGEGLAPPLREPLTEGAGERLAEGGVEEEGDAGGDAVVSADEGEGCPLSLLASERVAVWEALPLYEGGAMLGDAVGTPDVLAVGDKRAVEELAAEAVATAVTAADGEGGAVVSALKLPPAAPPPLPDAVRLS